MTRCINCKTNIDHLMGSGKLILWGCDGDFLCSTSCENEMKQKVHVINTMSDKQFEKWMIGG